MACSDALLFLDLEDSYLTSLEHKRPHRPSRRFRRNPLRFVFRLPSAISDCIPMEIVEVILNCLGNLPRCSSTLASCSLVCKAWHPISRYLLFRNATVCLGRTDPPLFIPYERDYFRIDWSQFSKIVLNPPAHFDPLFSATRYIQKISQSETDRWISFSNSESAAIGSEDIESLFNTVKGFTGLRSIVLEYYSAGTGTPLPAVLKRLDFQSMIHNISELEINGCALYCADVLILVAALRRLERLMLHNSHSFDGPPTTSLVVPPTLRTLRFWHSRYTLMMIILRWITSAPTSYITSFSSADGIIQSEKLSKYLALMGGSLVSLCIGTEGLNLSKNFNLRHLELTGIDLFDQRSTPTILNDALQTVTSNNLQTLVINLKIHQITDLDRLEWPTLSKIFDEPRFQKLQRLTFVVANIVRQAKDYLSKKLAGFGDRLDVTPWSVPEGIPHCLMDRYI